MKKGYKDLLEEANTLVEAVEPAEAARLHGASDVVFVDLRDPREREREGTIANAFSCPRGMLEFWIDPESPYHKPVFAEDKLPYRGAGPAPDRGRPDRLAKRRTAGGARGGEGEDMSPARPPVERRQQLPYLEP